MASGLEGPGQLYSEEDAEESDRQDGVGRTRPGPGGSSERTSGTSDTFTSNASGLSLGETIARSAGLVPMVIAEDDRSDVWFPLEMEADTSNGEEQMIAERDSALTSEPAVPMSQSHWPPQPGSSAQFEEQDSLLSPGLPLLVMALSGGGAVGSALVQHSLQQQISELEFTCLRETAASRDFTVGGFTTSPDVEKMSLSDSLSTGAVRDLCSSGSVGLSASQHPAAASQSLPSASELQAGWSAYEEADSSVLRSLTQYTISPGASSAEGSPKVHPSEHTKWPGLGSSTHPELSQHLIGSVSFDDRRPSKDAGRLAGLLEAPSQDSERQEEGSLSRGIAALSLATTDNKSHGAASEESRGAAQNEAGMQRERYLQATRLAYLGQAEPPTNQAVLAHSDAAAEISEVAVDDTGCRFATTQVESTSEMGSLIRDVIGGNAKSDSDAPSLISPVASVVLTEEDQRQISAIKDLVLQGSSVPAQGFVSERNRSMAFESFPQVNSSDCDTDRCWRQSYDRSDVKQNYKDGSRASIRHKTMALATNFSRATCVTDTWLQDSLLIATGESDENRREECSGRSVPSGAEPDDVDIDNPDAGRGVETSGHDRSSPPMHGSAVTLAMSAAGAFSLGQLGDISAEQDGDTVVSARSCGPSHTGNQTPALSTARSQASLEVDNYTPPWTGTGYGTGSQEFDIEQRIPVYLRNLGIEQPPTITGILDGRGPLCERDYSPSELTTIKDFGLSSASDGVLSNAADGSLGRGSGYSLRSELGQSTSLILDSDSSLQLSSSLTKTRTRATNENSEAAAGESSEGSGKGRSHLRFLDDVNKGHVQQEVEQSVRARTPASCEQEADVALSMEDLDNLTGDRSRKPSREQDHSQEVESSGLARYLGPARNSEYERPFQRAHSGYFHDEKGGDAVGETWRSSQSAEQAESQVSDLTIGVKTMLEIQKLLQDAGTYDRTTFEALCESNERDVLQSLHTDGRTVPSSSHELQTGNDHTVILDRKAEFDKTSTFTGKIRPTEHDYQSSYFPLGQDGHGSVEHLRPSVVKGAAKSFDVPSPFAQPELDLQSSRKSEKNTEHQTLPGSARHEPEGCSGATAGITPRPLSASSSPSHGDESGSSGRLSCADVDPQNYLPQSSTVALRSSYGSDGRDDDDVMARVRAILRGAAEHAGSQEDSDESVDAGPATKRRQGADGLQRGASPPVGAAPSPSQVHEDTGRPWLQDGATGGGSAIGFGLPLPPPPQPPASQSHAVVASGRLQREADAVSMESVVQRLTVLLSDKSPDNLAKSIIRRADEEEEISRELSLRMKLARDGADPAWQISRRDSSSVQTEDLRSLDMMGHGLQEQSGTESESESVTLTRVSHILSEASGSQCLASLNPSVVEPEPLNVLQRAHLRIASQLQRLSEEPFDSSVELASVVSGQQLRLALPDAPRQLEPGEQLPSQLWSQSRISDCAGLRGNVCVEEPLEEERSPSRLSEKSAAGKWVDQSRASSGLPDRLPDDRRRAAKRSIWLTGGERHASYEAWVTDRSFRANIQGSLSDLHAGINEISESERPNDKVSKAELIDMMGMAGEKTPPEGQEYKRPISSITFTSRKRGDSSPSTRSSSPTTGIAAQTRVPAASPECQPSSRASLVHTPMHFEQPAGLRVDTGVQYLMVANTTTPLKGLQTAATSGGEDKSDHSDHSPSRLSARSALTHMHIKLSPAKAAHSSPPTGTPSSSLPSSCTVIGAGKNNNGSGPHFGGAIAQAAWGRASPSRFQGSEAQSIQLRATARQEDTRSFKQAWPAGPPSYGTHEGPQSPVMHGAGNPLSFSFTFVSSAAAQGTADQPLVCPYRPAGSSELFYVPAVVGITGKSSSCTSQSTAESSHPGSNNALPPTFPAGVLGTRGRQTETGQDAEVPSSTLAGPSHVSWQPPCQGDSGSTGRVAAQDNIRYTSELSGWTSGGSAERGPPIAIHHLDGAQYVRSSSLTPDAGSAWLGRQRNRSAERAVGNFGESPVAYERAGSPDRQDWQESSGEVPELRARRHRLRSTGVESASSGASRGTRRTTEPSLDELWARFNLRQKELLALDSADEGTLLRKLEELARHFRHSQTVSGEGAWLTPTERMHAAIDTVSSTQRSTRLDEIGDRRQTYLEFEETWSSGSRISGGGGRMTPSSLAASSVSTDPDRQHDVSSVAETASTIDTARLVRAFGPRRVRLPSPTLRSLRDAVLRQREGPATYRMMATQGRRSGVTERSSQPLHAPSSSAATDSTWEGDHVAPPPPAESRGRRRSKGIQAGDLELVPGVKGHTRDVGVNVPSPAMVATAAGPHGEPTSGSPVRVSDGEGTVMAPAARRSRHNKQSRIPRKRQRPIRKPVSWFVPLDRRVDRDSDVSRQGVKENVSGHTGDRYEGSGTWHSPGRDGPAQGGSGAAAGGGGGGGGGSGGGGSGAPNSRSPLREMQQHDLEEELAGGALHSLERLTLQEALHMNRPAFVYRSRERVKRLQLMSEERRVQGVWQRERERLFGWGSRGRRRRHGQRQSSSAPTHPIFDNLFLAKRRAIPKKEAFVRSKSIYEQLPEVRRLREEQKKIAEYQSYRLKADNFQRKVTNKLLGRSTAWE